MIRCEKISKEYNGKTLLQEISFTLGKGEKVALVGRNGSGKSTLFRIISGSEESQSGSVFLPRGYRIGVLEQHAKHSFDTVLQEAISSIKNEEEASDWKAERILFCLGFSEELLQAHPMTLSGGYTLRLQLAKLLLSDPDLLLLDEPTNYLDIKTIQWLIQFLKAFRGEIIAISHDRDFLDAISTHTMGIHRQKLHKIEGTTSDYFRFIWAQEEIHQKTVEKIEKEKANLQKFIDRFGAKATKAKQAQSRAKAIERLPELEKLVAIDSLAFSFKNAPFGAKTILSATDLSFHYPDKESDLFSHLSFSLSPGETLCIAGRNGKGKSTLLRLLKGELTPTTGHITLHPSVSVGYFGQTNIDRLSSDLTIEDEVKLANPLLTYEEIRSIAGVMMFSGDDAKKKIKVLSGGEKSRVLLGKILATPIQLLLLDEPTNHLDMESIEALALALEEFEGASVIVTHSEALLHRLADSLIIFDEDEAFFYPSTYQDFLERKGWKSDSILQKEGAKLLPSQIAKKDDISTTTASSQRHERALRVQERAKMLKPILKAIEQIENEISTREKKKKECEDSLIQAVESGRSLEIEPLSRQIKESEKRIEDLFDQLEKEESERIRILSLFPDL